MTLDPRDASPRPAPMPAPLRLRLMDERATARLGAALAEVLGPGDTVLLAGPLGSGKTALARAIIRARFGAPALEVPSPSYTLVNLYEDAGGGEVWHADLYRLAGDTAELAELGLEEAFGRALVLVEWPERLGPASPRRHLDITLDFADADAEARIATIAFAGGGWAAVRRRLAALTMERAADAKAEGP